MLACDAWNVRALTQLASSAATKPEPGLEGAGCSRNRRLGVGGPGALLLDGISKPEPGGVRGGPRPPSGLLHPWFHGVGNLSFGARIAAPGLSSRRAPALVARSPRRGTIAISKDRVLPGSRFLSWGWAARLNRGGRSPVHRGGEGRHRGSPEAVSQSA